MGIAILGDLHFRDDKPWSIKLIDEFFNWYRAWDKNSPENSLVLAGDLVQKATNNGLVISAIEQLVNEARFNGIYICVGNHDKKLLNGMNQLAYDFLKQRQGVYVIEEATELEVQGQKTLFLPYFLGVNSKGRTMKEYYSSIHENPDFTNDYDLVVGHFCDVSISFGDGIDCVHNIEKIKTRKMCLGHIHTRSTLPEIYIGSVFPNSSAENDDTRAAWYWDGKVWVEELLPIFAEYVKVLYPEELPKTQALVPIYQVFGCANEVLVKAQYGDIMISSLSADTSKQANDRAAELERCFDDIINLDYHELFNKFMETQSTKIPKEVLESCFKLL